MHPNRKSIQNYELELKKKNPEEKELRNSRRLISLRFNEYLVYSARNTSRTAGYTDYVKRALREHAINHEKHFINNCKDVPIKTLEMFKFAKTEKEIKNDASKKQQTTTINRYLSDIKTYYAKSFIYKLDKDCNHGKNLAPNSIWNFISHFLDSVEEKYGLNYRLHFHKDIYLPDDTVILPGIYKLERRSTLNPQKVSVSKITVIHNIDNSGKNVFNEDGLIRITFVEEKKSTKRSKKFELINKGKVIIRGSSNLIFIGAAYHGGKARGGAVEKDIHTMMLRAGEDDQKYFYGICLEAIHDSSHDPFAARVKLTYMNLTDEKSADVEFEQRDFDEKNDKHLINVIDPQSYILKSY